MRLCLRDPEHHRKPRVLLDRLRIDRIAVERVGEPLDLEALLGRGLRRQRRAGDRDDGLHLIFSGVGDAQRLLEVARADGAKERALHCLTADIERHVPGVLGHGARRQQQPSVLLRGGRAQSGACGLDPLLGGLHRGAGRAALGGERDQRGGIAQTRTEVEAAGEIRQRLRPERGERGGEYPLGPRAVAGERKRSGDLRLGDRSLQRVELGVGEIAQIADRRRAVARQHVERVSKIAAIVLARIRRRADDVAQAIERKTERRFGHGELALARAGEKIGDVGIEPDVVTAADTPEPEGAVRDPAASAACRWRRGCADRRPVAARRGFPWRDR